MARIQAPGAGTDRPTDANEPAPTAPAVPLGDYPRLARDGHGLRVSAADSLAACPRIRVTDLDPTVIESTPQAPDDLTVADLASLVAAHDFSRPFGQQIAASDASDVIARD